MNLIKNTLTSLRDVFNRSEETESGRTENTLGNNEDNISSAQSETGHSTVSNNSRPDWYESTHGPSN